MPMVTPANNNNNGGNNKKLAMTHIGCGNNKRRNNECFCNNEGFIRFVVSQANDEV